MILIFFADMLRANKFFTGDCKGKLNPLEAKLRDLGGNFHSNCLTLAPDTPRSLGVLWTGKSPKDNGMSTRHKYPGHEIKAADDTLFSGLIERGVPLHIVHESIVQANLIFPPSVKTYASFYPNVASLIKSKNTAEGRQSTNEVVFIVSNTYHNEVSRRFAHKSSHDAACGLLAEEINLAVNEFGLSPGDHLVVFSDHGCKLSDDKFGSLAHLNRDRSQVVLFHSRLDGASLTIEDKLSDMIDIHNFFKSLFFSDAESAEHLSSGQLEMPKANKAVVVEDHETYATRPGEPILSWAVYTNNFEYFESAGFGLRINLLTEPNTSCERLFRIEEAKNELRLRASGYLELEKSRSLLSPDRLSIPPDKILYYQNLSHGGESSGSWRETKLEMVLFFVLTLPTNALRRLRSLWVKAMRAKSAQKVPGSHQAAASIE